MSNKKAAKETVHLLLSVNRLHRSLAERQLADRGIYNGQLMILRRIAECKEAIRQKDLSEFFGVTPAAIANSLRRMEKAGLVERSTAQMDSRCNDIRITKEGWKILEVAGDTSDAVDSAIISALSEEELENFRNCLEKIHATLEKLNK